MKKTTNIPAATAAPHNAYASENDSSNAGSSKMPEKNNSPEYAMALVLNNTDENFILVDMNFRVILFNKQFQNHYRKYFDREIRRGDPILDLASADRREDVKKIYREVFAGKTLETETEIPLGDQGLLTFSNNFKPAYDENGNIIGAAVTSRDITEKKRSMALLVANERRFRTMVENSTDAIAILSAEGKAMYVSQSVQSILGYTEEEAVQTNIYDIIHPDDTPGIEKALELIMSNPGVPIAGTVTRIRHKNGTWRWIEATLTNMLHDPSINGIIDNFRDITEKITAEKIIREERMLLRTLIDNLPLNVYTKNLQSKKTLANRTDYEYSGMSTEAEVLGKDDYELYAEESARNTIEEDRFIFSTGQSIINKEEYHIRKDGSHAWFLISKIPILNEENEITGLIGISYDITERKVIEQQLNDAYHFNQTVIETSPAGIWIYEESGKAINVNRAAVVLAGTSVEDLLSLNFRELESWKNTELHNAAIEALESGKMVRTEVHYHNRVNAETWFEAFLTPVQFKGKKHLMVMTYDIRERMHAEEALKKSKTQLSIATQLARLGYWELNIDEGVFTFNDQFYAMLRTTAEEMGGFSMSAQRYSDLFLHPDDRKLVGEEIRIAIESADPFYTRDLEHRIIHLNGDIGYLAVRFYVVKDENGRTIRTVGANQDITEQKIAADQIRQAKERYEMVHKATNDAIYEWDIVNDTSYWGEGYETLFGHKRTGDKMDSLSWTENLHPDEKDMLIAEIRNAFKEKKTTLTRELRFRCADNSYKIIFDKLIIRYDPDGEPLKVFGAMQDISELKKNETSIRELNEKLNKRAEELATSNAELERFAYVASHDLQEPLRMVSSFLQLLQKKYNNLFDETGTEYINYAVDGAERMKRLILDLLEYSRVGTSQDMFVKTDINQVMQQVLDVFSNKIMEKNALIKVGQLPVIRANTMQITQLLQNLVGNALKYNTSAVPEIEIGCEDKGHAWQFSIKDNGIGIDPKFFNKIFIIFQRLHNKNQFSGTGIGLAICKKIVEKHGGNIWIQSDPGKGSTFFFTIQKNLNLPQL